MDWSLLDFAFMGALIGSVILVIRLTFKKSANKAYRSGAALALAAAFLLIWLNGAVGIIGSENNDANAMFAGVLAIAIAGVLITRGRPGGMARVFYVTAAAQSLVAVVELIIQTGASDPSWPLDVILLTVFFCAIWLLSARMFQKAAEAQPEKP